MKNELQELFQFAAKFFLKKYKKKGGAQSKLAAELGITQSYLSSVTSGSRTASLELYNQIAQKLYGPLDKFLAVGRRIKEGKPPLEEKEKPPEDSVENLIARLTYYVVDHQQIEKELAEVKKFYENIVEKQPTGILVMDMNHTVYYANKYMEKLARISADKIIGTSPYDAEKKIEGLDIRAFREIYHEAFKKLQPLVYKNIKTKMPDNETLFISGSFTPLTEKGVFSGMICSIHDTTTSHILKNLLINTLNFSSHGIGIVQQTGPGEQPKVYFKNSRFDEIFGLEEIDPSKVNFGDVLKIMASRIKNSKKWLDFINKSILTDKVDQKIVITLKNSKKYNWVSNPLIDKDGMHWGRIVTVEETNGKTKTANKR